MLEFDKYKEFLDEKVVESINDYNAQIKKLHEDLIESMSICEIPDPHSPQHMRNMYDHYCHAGLRRFLRLYEGFAQAWNSGHLTICSLIGRALIEGTATLNHLNTELRKVIQNKNYDKAYNLIASYALVGRSETGLKISERANVINIHINDALRSLNREYKIVNKVYDWISDFVHPNCPGVILSFSRFRKDKNLVFFLQNEEIQTATLSTCLEGLLFVPIHAHEWKQSRELSEQIVQLDWKPSNTFLEYLFKPKTSAK